MSMQIPGVLDYRLDVKQAGRKETLVSPPSAVSAERDKTGVPA
jgi:hypothetical protein